MSVIAHDHSPDDAWIEETERGIREDVHRAAIHLIRVERERDDLATQLQGAVDLLRAFALEDVDFKVFAVEGGPVYVPVAREQAEAIRDLLGGQ
jgi:hypothetical protein